MINKKHVTCLLLAVMMWGGIVKADESLDGTKWMMHGEGQSDQWDLLLFDDEIFTSVDCFPYGFKPGKYETTSEGKVLSWIAVQYNKKKERMTWKGERKGNTMTGSYEWLAGDKSMQMKWEAVQLTDQGHLDQTNWDMKEKKKKSGTDVLKFHEGKFVSTECIPYGFEGGRYESAKAGKVAVWSAIQVSDESGKMIWAGAQSESSMTGNYYWFTKKKVQKVSWTAEQRK